jgi:hypothetical protein
MQNTTNPRMTEFLQQTKEPYQLKIIIHHINAGNIRHSVMQLPEICQGTPSQIKYIYENCLLCLEGPLYLMHHSFSRVYRFKQTYHYANEMKQVMLI